MKINKANSICFSCTLPCSRFYNQLDLTGMQRSGFACNRIVRNLSKDRLNLGGLWTQLTIVLRYVLCRIRDAPFNRTLSKATKFTHAIQILLRLNLFGQFLAVN
jgi:hypothetical protein